MGLLYTTEVTRRILDTLNTAFDGPAAGLQIIRDAKDGDPKQKLQKLLEKGKWQPGQFAKAVQLFPYDQSGAGAQIEKKDIQRWAYFLKKVVGKDQFDQMTAALAAAILDRVLFKKIVRIVFDHVELPKGTNQNLVIFDAPLPGGGWARYFTMFTENAEDGKTDDFGSYSDDPDPISPPWKTSNPP